MQAPILAEIPFKRWSHSAREWLEARCIDRTMVFEVQLTTRFRGVNARRGILLQGPGGWGECAPFEEYAPNEASLWLQSAAEAACDGVGIPSVRDAVPVNVTIPVVNPEEAANRAHAAGCRTAKIKVADPRSTPRQDWERIRAVSRILARDFGSDARVRIDANGKWNREEAVQSIAHLGEAAAPVGGFEYVEQPCMKVEDLAWVRERVGVPLAADESIRRAVDPFRVVEYEAADLAVIKVAPLGGVRRALDLAHQLPIPVVVSSAIDTSIGLSAGVALAAGLSELPYACGLDTQRLLVGDVAEPLVSHDGFLSLADARRIAAGDLVDIDALIDADAPMETDTVADADARVPLADTWVERVEAMIATRGNRDAA